MRNFKGLISFIAGAVAFGSVAAVAGPDEHIRQGIRDHIKQKQEQARVAAVQGQVQQAQDKGAEKRPDVAANHKNSSN